MNRCSVFTNACKHARDAVCMRVGLCTRVSVCVFIQIARASPFSTNICIDDCQFLSLTNHRQITRSLDGASKPFIVKPQTQPLHRKKRASLFSLQDRIFTKAFPFFQNITRTRDCESKREKVKLKENSANEEFWYGLPRIEGPPGRRGLFT